MGPCLKCVTPRQPRGRLTWGTPRSGGWFVRVEILDVVLPASEVIEGIKAGSDGAV